jgi:tetratricopeptide (TPR) repeat protein
MHVESAFFHSQALRHDSSASSSLQKQYLHLKVQTLQKALDNPSIVMAEQQTTSLHLPISHTPSSKSHRPNTGDPTEETADTFLRTLNLLRLLKRANQNRGTFLSQSELAKRLNALSTALYDLGLFDDSCTMSHHAVHLFRHLVRTAKPGEGGFKSSLAGALNNLSTHIDAAATTRNAPEHALELLQEAIQIYRDLIATGQEVFRSDLAVILINSATRLGQLNRHQEAARAAMDALDIYTSLAHDHPHNFSMDRVESLIAVSATLRDTNRHSDSLLAAEKAVDICRMLATNAVGSTSRKFQPELAASLMAYSRSLSVDSKFDKALEAAEEALKIRRTLARSRPDVYTRPLALSLLDVFKLQQRGKRYREAASKTAELMFIQLVRRPGLKRKSPSTLRNE